MWGAPVAAMTRSAWRQALGQRVKVHGLAAQAGRQPRRLVEGAVGDQQEAQPGLGQRAARQLAHLAGADDQGGAVGQVAQGLPGQRRRHLPQRPRPQADLRLRPRALAGVEGLPEERGEDRPGGAGRLGGLEGRLDLAQDLILAHQQRVEPGGHARQVAGGLAVAADVEVGPQVAGGQAATPGQGGQEPLLLGMAGRLSAVLAGRTPRRSAAVAPPPHTPPAGCRWRAGPARRRPRPRAGRAAPRPAGPARRPAARGPQRASCCD